MPPAVTFVAPVDPLVAGRRQLLELFDFEYRWEIFTPEPKRQFGYYVLPILFGDRFVGRIEPRLDKIDRAAGALRILGLWWEKGFNPRADEAFVPALRDALGRLPRVRRSGAGRVAAALLSSVGCGLVGRESWPCVALTIASTCRVGVGLGRHPVRDADPDRRLAVPGRATHPGGAVGLDPANDLARELVGVAAAGRRDPHQHLVEHDVVEHLEARLRAQLLGHPRGQVAAALHQLAHALPPSERSVAYSAKPRARRDESRTQSQPSRCASVRCRYAPEPDIAAWWLAGSRTATNPQS